jgi:hypothetical protein
VNDDQGNSTTVVLGDVTVGGRLPDSLFNIQINTEREGGR